MRVYKEIKILASTVESVEKELHNGRNSERNTTVNGVKKRDGRLGKLAFWTTEVDYDDT